MTNQLVDKENPILKRTALEVPHRENKINLIHGMIQVMKKRGGIGLAAPQVGISQRVIIIRFGDDAQEIINPVIIKRYGGQSSQMEGCLSFPNQEVKKKRYKRIKVEGYDLDWQRVSLKLSGLEARCVQHAVDHLNGITIK